MSSSWKLWCLKKYIKWDISGHDFAHRYFDCPPRAALLAVHIYMDHWHLKLSVMSKQFSSLSLPTLVPWALGSLPLGAYVSVSGSLEPSARLCIFASLPHLLAFAAIPQCAAACRAEDEPSQALLEPAECFQFRVVERAQPINMLGQCYQTVSLLGVIDDGPSTLSQQTC